MQEITGKEGLLRVRFFVEAAPSMDEAGEPASKMAEFCEISLPGDSKSMPVFPAHERARQMNDGSWISYAQLFRSEYQAWKTGDEQMITGSPLSEVEWLTQAQKSELSALNVVTIEALAALPDRMLGKFGSFINAAKQRAKELVAEMGSTSGGEEIEALKARIAELEARDTALTGDQFDAMDGDQLKGFIKERTGAAPRGNPSIETLQKMAREIK